MATDVVELLVLNEVYFLIGLGIAALLGVVDARPATWWRLPVAYLLGVAVVGILSSYLALFGYGVGWVALIFATAISLTLGWLRVDRSATSPLPRVIRRPPRPLETACGFALLGVVGVVLAISIRLQAIRPLVEWDAWAMWALKARVLYELPGEAASILRDPDYGHPTYPLVLPALEAIGFRAMGRFDAVLIGLQFGFLLLGLIGAIWACCREHCSPIVVALVLVVLVAAPQMHYQLGTKYADVPLAIFVGAGLTALARWLMGNGTEIWPLASGVVLLGTAGLMKNEGLLFVAAAAVAVILAAVLIGRRRLIEAAVSAGALAAIVLPWRVYGAVYDLPTSDYDLLDMVNPRYLAEHSDRVRPVVQELWNQMTTADNWNWTVAIVLLAIVGCLAAGDRPIAVFASAWLALAFGGLVATYWISSLPTESNLTNSSYRTIVSIVIGASCLTAPLLRRVPEAAGTIVDVFSSAARRRN